MFRKVMIGLALLTTVSFSSSALGEVPDTFLGEWQVDIARTLLTHVKEMAEISPEIAGGMQVAKLEKMLAQGEPAIGSEVLITITEKTITWKQALSNLYEDMPYRVIGGNSAEVIVELFPSEGEPAITTIRLVEGGIALSEEDCSDDPERCVRRQEMAAAQREERELQVEVPVVHKIEDDPSVDIVIVETDLVENKSSASDSQSPTKQNIDIQPRWMYLKKPN